MERTLRCIGAIYRDAKLRSGSSRKSDLLESRIAQACGQRDLVRFVEMLAELLQATLDNEHLPGVFQEANRDGESILRWIREHVKATAALAILSVYEKDQFAAAVKDLTSEGIRTEKAGDKTVESPAHDIDVMVEVLTPLSHGADNKMGNFTLFRRQEMIARNGGVIRLPFYSGNALRGQIRDLLADHLTLSLGLSTDKDRMAYRPWFFHTLYAGGELAETGKGKAAVPRAALKVIGERPNLTVDLADHKRFRTMIPMLSLLGCAIGNQIFAGRVRIGDLLPECAETGAGDTPAHELLTWEYLTRRDDRENLGEEDQHHGMVATWEVIKAGTHMRGGIDLEPNIQEIEKSCLALGLQLLQDHGVLGACARRGWGQVRIEYSGDLPSTKTYVSFLEKSKKEILSYLQEMEAIENAGD